MFITAIIIALLVGVVIGHIEAVLFASGVVVKHSTFCRELVIRGDAAMAMLKRVGDDLERLGQGKKVVLADDLRAAKNAIDVGYSKKVVTAPKG